MRRICEVVLIGLTLGACGLATSVQAQGPRPPLVGPGPGPGFRRRPPEAAKPLADAATLKARLQARLDRLVAEDGFEGVVRVDLHGQPLMRTGVGYADPTRKIAYTADTQVEMGSIGKSFTAVAVLKLWDHGRLTLDDPIGKFLPDVPADKAGVTIRQLLNHTAGFGPGRNDARLGRAAFERAALAAPLLFAPGQRHAYSNIGFGLAADIVERVSGQAYEDFLIAEVLTPGGATHTGYGRAYEDGKAERGDDGQTVIDTIWGPGGPYWNVIGGGGLMTTVDDMAAFRRAFLEGKIVSPAAVAEATTNGVDEGPGRPERYGLGVGLAEHPLYGRLVQHNGGNPWFSSDFRQLLDHDLFIFVSGNSRAAAPDVASKLLRALFDASDPPPRPGAEVGEALAKALAVVIQDSDPAGRRAFLNTQVDPDFVAQAGAEALLKELETLHAALVGKHPARVQTNGMDRAFVIFDPPEKGRPLALEVLLAGDPRAPKIGGWRLRR